MPMEITERILEGLKARTVSYGQSFKRRKSWLEQILGLHPSSRRITPLGRMYGRLAWLCLEKGTEKNRSKEKRGCFRKIDYQRVALFLYRKKYADAYKHIQKWSCFHSIHRIRGKQKYWTSYEFLLSFLKQVSNRHPKTLLRYPGGKQKLTPFIEALLRENELIGCDYVEPYAGGAGVAMELLFKNYVRKV